MEKEESMFARVLRENGFSFFGRKKCHQAQAEEHDGEQRQGEERHESRNKGSCERKDAISINVMFF